MKRIISMLLCLCMFAAFLTTAASASTQFTDVADGDYFAVPVEWAVAQNITNDTCTRGRIVTFLHRYFVKPLDTSNISIGVLSHDSDIVIDLGGHEELAQPEATSPAEIPESELDPLPPPSYMDHPDWYMSLTPVDDMSDARLMAEYDRISHVIREKSSDELGDAVYARQLDLRAELDRRGLEW